MAAAMRTSSSTTSTLMLVDHEGEAESPLRSTASQAGSQAGAVASRPMRLLLVEDDAKLAAAVARGLIADGYAVDQAGDGDGALLQAGIYEYDAIVLDVMLPVRDGFDVCRTLRDRECTVP